MDARPDQPSPEATPAAPPGPEDAGSLRPRPWRTALEMLGLGPPPPGGHRFHALISYSHASDSRLATALQRGLQRFARPWYRTRALHVFRDNASLAANPHLWRSVQAGLDASQHFVLLASRAAAASPWVARECAYWRETKSIERLLIVLTDGEIAWDDSAGDFDRTATTALPAPLFGAFAGEPRWIDLRWAAGAAGLTLANPRFREAIAELGAPLHGLPRDELDSIEVRERRRAVRLARGATAALALLLVAAVVAAILALKARDEANRQSHVAQSRAVAVQALDQFGSAGALTAARPDLGVLLALEAYRLAPTEEARGAVLGALEASDRMTGYVHSAGGPIDDLAYSPDGRTIAVETGNGGVELWSARPLRRVGVLPLPAGDLRDSYGGSSLAFSPDGELLALAGVGALGRSTTGAAVWGLRSGRLLRAPLTRPDAAAQAVAFAPSGGLLIGTLDGAVRIWNAAQGRQLGALPVGCAQHGNGSVQSLAVSATATVVVGCSDGSVWVWRSATPNTDPARLAAPSGARPPQVAISSDGALIVAGDGAGRIAAWAFDANTASYRSSGRSPSLGDGAVDSVKLSPDREYLAAAYGDGRLRVWTPGGTQPVWSYESTPSPLRGVSWSRDGRTLVAGGDDGLGVLWRAPPAHGARPPSDLYTVLDGGATTGGPIAFDPGGRYLAAAEPRGVELWDARRVRRLSTAPDSAAAGRIAVAPHRLAAVVSSKADAPVLRIWDTSDPRAPRADGMPLRTRASIVGAIALDAGGRTLAAAVTLPQNRSGIELWDLRTRRMRLVRTPPFGYSVSFAPNTSTVVVGESAGVIQSIDYAGAAPRARTLVAADATDGAVVSIAHSADGGTLAEGASGVVRILDARSGQVIGTPVRGADPVAVAYGPGGELLAIADMRGRVQLIGAASQVPFGRQLPARGSATATASTVVPVIDSVAFSSDGGLLAAGGSGPVTLWNRLLWTDAGYAQRRERLCGLVGRNLTALEWRTFLPGQPYRRTCPRWPAGH